MNAPDRLLAHPDYQRAIRAIAEREQDRRFCRHGLDHVSDVARLLWILVIENERPFDKDTVLLTAMLHDIGRSVDNDNHDAESVRIAQRSTLRLRRARRFFPPSPATATKMRPSIHSKPASASSWPSQTRRAAPAIAVLQPQTATGQKPSKTKPSPFKEASNVHRTKIF